LARRATLLWFNAEKDVGAARTEDGDLLDVPGDAFAPGEKPVARCAGRLIDVEVPDGVVTRVVFLEDANPRRARMRHRR
jgi:hypothetical protein